MVSVFQKMPGIVCPPFVSFRFKGFRYQKFTWV
jgi:hypothetical protein